jgi:uncharacterized cupin superfamily protein
MTSVSDSRINGIDPSVALKAPVHAVATGNVTLSGLQTVGGVVLDGSTLYRVLCTAQTNSVDNGIWDASTGSWSRSKDFDGPRDVVKGTLITTDSGSASTLYYRVTTSNPITPGSTSIAFQVLSPTDTLRADLAAGNANLVKTTALKYDITPAETAAGAPPVNYYIEPGLIDRQSSAANYAAVWAATSTLARYNTAALRADRANHPAGTNVIVGFESYDDSQKTGTVGYRCTAIGVQALQSNGASVTAGGTNTAIGWACMQHVIECSGNTAVGAAALNSITGVNSSHNNAFGYRVLPSLVNGTQNNCFGFQVCDLLVTGDNNHGYGENALSHLLLGYGNHNFGYQSCYSKIAGEFTHALGYQTLFNETSATITAITKAAAAVITISTVSTINPFSVGQPIIVDGAGGMVEINRVVGFVTAIGGVSGAWTVTVGINSTGFTTFTSGGYLSPLGNTVFGYRVGTNVSMRGGCTMTGYDSVQTGEPGYGTTTYGFQAGLTINCNAGGDKGELNTLMGFWSGRQITSGAQNSSFGQRSGENITTGSENCNLGPNSGNGITTANKNVSVGSQTAVNLNGNSNTQVGYNAGSQGSAQTYTNCGSFGANAVPTASNQITLGDSSIATLRCQQTTITALSDSRFKKNIKPLDIPDAFLDEVEIVTYEWLLEGMPTGPQVGVIAQQLDALQEKYGLQWLGLVDKSNPDRWEATPGKLLFPLIVKTQKLSRRVAALESHR